MLLFSTAVCLLVPPPPLLWPSNVVCKWLQLTGNFFLLLFLFFVFSFIKLLICAISVASRKKGKKFVIANSSVVIFNYIFLDIFLLDLKMVIAPKRFNSLIQFLDCIARIRQNMVWYIASIDLIPLFAPSFSSIFLLQSYHLRSTVWAYFCSFIGENTIGEREQYTFTITTWVAFYWSQVHLRRILPLCL